MTCPWCETTIIVVGVDPVETISDEIVDNLDEIDWSDFDEL